MRESSYEQKCAHRQINCDPDGLTSPHLKEWNQAAWLNQLKPMLITLPDYEKVWSEWERACCRLFAGEEI